MSKLKRCALFVMTAAGLMGLLSACGGTSEQVVDRQVATGLPPNEQVFAYASSGNLSGLKSLVESDPSLVNAVNEKKQTPMHYAAGHGQTSVVKYLLEKGANPAALDMDSMTPAEAALQGVHVELSQLIREASAKGGAAAPAPAEGAK